MSQTTVYLTGKRFQFIIYRLSDHSAFAKLRSHLPALTFLTQSLQYMLTLELCFKEQRGKEPGGCVAIPSTTGSAEGCFLDYVSLCFFWGYLSSEKAPQPCRHSCGCSSPSTPRTWRNTGNMETRKAANKCEPDPKPAKANGSYFSWYNSLPNTGTLGGKTSHNTWVFNSTLSKRCCITYSFSCDLKKKKNCFSEVIHFPSHLQSCLLGLALQEVFTPLCLLYTILLVINIWKTWLIGGWGSYQTWVAAWLCHAYLKMKRSGTRQPFF